MRSDCLKLDSEYLRVYRLTRHSPSLVVLDVRERLLVLLVWRMQANFIQKSGRGTAL